MVSCKAVLPTLFLILATTSAWAMQSKPPDKPPPPPSRDRPPPSQDRRLQQRDVLNLSGKVVLDDGTVPPETLQVELMCNGRVIRQRFTGPKGSFHFELGRRNSARNFDASVGGAAFLGIGIDEGQSSGPSSYTTPEGIRVTGRGRFDLNGCQIRLSPLPGYLSNDIILTARSVFDKSDVGYIALTKRDDESGTLVSLNTLSAPPKARKAYDKARREVMKKKIKHKKVVKELQKAVALYPEFAAAWNLLGEIKLQQKDPEAARQAFQKSMAADVKYLSPLLNMARMELTAGKWIEAAKFTEQLVELSPDLAQGRYFHGVANYYLGKHDIAEQSLDVVEKNGAIENYPATCYIRGDILLRRGQVPAAAEQFRRYLDLGRQIPEGVRTKIVTQLGKWEEQGEIEPAPPTSPASAEQPPGK